MLLSKKVKVKWHSSNKKWYESKGYIFTNWKEEFEVKVEDLQDNSIVKINVKCDCIDCKKPYLKPVKWQDYKRYVHKDGKYYCHNCAIKLYGSKRRVKSALNNSISFEQWCYDNLNIDYANEILAQWDNDLNKCSPNEICYSTNKKFYFKCNKNIRHKSELKSINDFTGGHDGIMDCNQCNSFAQYLIDTYGKDSINQYWSDKNIINPWNISKSCGKYVFIKCQEKDYHEDYKIKCDDFTNSVRCPYCQGLKVHPLDSLGQLLEDKNLLYIWSDKNKKSPYEYSPVSGKEVWWKCLDNKHEDYYRKISNSKNFNFRCPECVKERNESILEEKVRLYLQSLKYKVLTENKCTLIPTNPKTKYPLPFDNEIILINGKHLLCEVMGIQHYEELPEKNKWLNGKTPKEYLHYQKLKDRYKRFIAYKNGYEYLELPYWIDDNNETYKKLINDKIINLE